MDSSIAGQIKQLRDAFYGRYTYHDIEEWVDNLESCIVELCQSVGMDTSHMKYHDIEEIGKCIIAKIDGMKTLKGE